MSRIIAISNFKGGVAKTSTTLNLGAALALDGNKVLLVDVDPQCNLSETLLKSLPTDTVYTAMTGEGAPSPIEIKKNLFLMSSDKNLNAADILLGPLDDAQIRLKKILDPIRKDYDYILIDCPPSRALITVNALAAADEVIIPTTAEILSVRGMKDMNELISLVRDRINPKLKISGLLVTKYGGRTSAEKCVAGTIDVIASSLGTITFRTKVRQNVAVVESQMSMQDVIEMNPSAKAAQDYVALAKEIQEM